MQILSRLTCLINRHRPNRRKVVWTGKQFSGRCKHCGHTIMRQGHRKWRLDPATVRYGEPETMRHSRN